MLDPIFDLLAGLLEWFYSLVPSYGFAIIALTTLVLLALSPLTYKSTKSMVAMRRVQPQIKRLQKKHKGDREKLNQEMMALYQEHQVSPLSGCLPILIQSPVFIVMFRVIRGITRRSSTIGFDAAQGAVYENRGALVDAAGNPIGVGSIWEDIAERNNFNPEYLDPSSDMYQSLVNDNEMNWIGIDLSRTPLEVLGDSISTALPYLIMIVLVAGLGWYQQVQIQGRMTGEVSAQQQMIMRIMPWMLPIFSFTMPAGLVLYFIVSALLRIIQQAYLTRNVYGNEELTKPIEVDDDDDFDDDDDDDEPENPLAALFGGASKSKSADPTPSSRHGSRRPTSGDGANKRNRPRRSNASSSSNGSTLSKKSVAKDTASKDTASKKAASKKPAAAKDGAAKKSAPKEKVSGWGRAKRSAPESNQQPAKPVSRRVTPKGDSPSGRRGKK